MKRVTLYSSSRSAISGRSRQRPNRNPAQVRIEPTTDLRHKLRLKNRVRAGVTYARATNARCGWQPPGCCRYWWFYPQVNYAGAASGHSGRFNAQCCTRSRRMFCRPRRRKRTRSFDRRSSRIRRMEPNKNGEQDEKGVGTGVVIVDKGGLDQSSCGIRRQAGAVVFC